MAGSALDTTVLDSIATNIARRRPERASSTWRWLMEPAASAVDGTGWVGLDVADKTDISIHRWKMWLTVSTVAVSQPIPRRSDRPKNADNPQVWARRAPSGGRAAGSPAGRVSALDCQQYYERLAVGCC